MAEVEEPPSTPVSTKTAPEKVLRSSRPPPGTDIHNSQTDDSLETPCKKTSLSALKFHRPQTKGDLTPRTKDGFLRENAWLREQVSHLQQDLNHVREENSQLHARIQNLMDDLVGGHQAHNEQEFLLQEAQKKAYSVLEDPMWESDSEKTTRRLDQFAKQIQQWSKQYASQKDLHELMETSKALRDSLERVLRLDGDGHPHSLLGAKGTSMALLAYLTHLLFEKIVTKPFFFLDSSSPVTAEAKEVGLIEMYIDTLCYDEVEAQQWRAQTLRLLRPRSSTQDSPKAKHVVELNAKTQTDMKAACDKLVARFFKSSAMRLLINKDKDQKAMKAGLHKIFHEAGELSCYIGTQKVDLRVARLDSLPSLVFDHRNLYIEAHASHRAQLDEDESSLDGHEIHQMLHPAIVVFGNSDGTDYDKLTIWKKAIVWMGVSE